MLNKHIKALSKYKHIKAKVEISLLEVYIEFNLSLKKKLIK